MLRLRVGIILVLVSWLPVAQVWIEVAHSHGRLTDEHMATQVRLLIWGIQILIGILGLGLAGKVALQEAKQAGWKQTPRRLWQLFWRGQQPAEH